MNAYLKARQDEATVALALRDEDVGNRRDRSEPSSSTMVLPGTSATED